ncbi:hypothetical protein, partial [Halopseudomonas formosensis]
PPVSLIVKRSVWDIVAAESYENQKYGLKLASEIWSESHSLAASSAGSISLSDGRYLRDYGHLSKQVSLATERGTGLGMVQDS